MKEKKHAPDLLYMQWMDDFHKESKQRENYSSARMDLLTVSICGAGLYVCLETLKFLLSAPALTMPSWPIKVAGVLFTAAIAINFWSQHTGRRCNRAAAQWARYESLAENSGNPKAERERFSKDMDHFGLLTRQLNRVSTAIMIIGVVALVAFYITCL